MRCQLTKAHDYIHTIFIKFKIYLFQYLNKIYKKFILNKKKQIEIL